MMPHEKERRRAARSGPLEPRVVDEEVVERNAARCAERGVLLPTLAQLKDPKRLVPRWVQEELASVDLWDSHNPLNLFRITWRNEPAESGGGYSDRVNCLELPPELTGLDATVVGLLGNWFPTGCHKVGAAYGVLVREMVTGAFDAQTTQAAWPSTGNYCRGGAFDSALLGVDSVAILPEEMSSERFEWLRALSDRHEVIRTPGSESNVKEIYDKCWELRRERGDRIHVFNQFENFGNPLWHYHVTGEAAEAAFRQTAEAAGGGRRCSRLAAYVSATGSAGTLAAGDYLRTRFPHVRVVAAEALQCPTLALNGHGAHRIEGIGDKHVPWVHNVRNTDAVASVDDERVMRIFRLFNEPEGHRALERHGVPPEVVRRLPLLGISGVCNMVAAIKAARHFDLDERDVIVTPLTDSSSMYRSRLDELERERGPLTMVQAERDHARYLLGVQDDHFAELTYQDRKRLHGLKYFTWVEQQGKSPEELRAMWDPEYWERVWGQAGEWDRLIGDFNRRSGVGHGRGQ